MDPPVEPPVSLPFPPVEGAPVGVAYPLEAPGAVPTGAEATGAEATGAEATGADATGAEVAIVARVDWAALEAPGAKTPPPVAEAAGAEAAGADAGAD